MKYRKKPIVIDAVQWNGSNHECWQPWMLDAMALPTGTLGAVGRDGRALRIHTLEGTMRADDGDWIIRGVKGEIYPCKPDIFAATYEIA